LHDALPIWLARWFFFKKVLRDFHILSRAARWLRMYQRSGLQKTVRASGVLKVLGLQDVERLSPRIDDEFTFNELGTFYPAERETRATVAFHAGCIAHVAFADLNRATIHVLHKNGVA